jgi:hypothetical protein
MAKLRASPDTSAFTKLKRRCFDAGTEKKKNRACQELTAFIHQKDRTDEEKKALLGILPGLPLVADLVPSAEHLGAIARDAVALSRLLSVIRAEGEPPRNQAVQGEVCVEARLILCNLRKVLDRTRVPVYERSIPAVANWPKGTAGLLSQMLVDLDLIEERLAVPDVTIPVDLRTRFTESAKLLAEAAGPPAAGPMTPPSQPEEILIDADTTILRVLSEAKRAFTFAQIARESVKLVKEQGGSAAQDAGLVCVSETTVKARVLVLLEQRLVARPTGKNGKPMVRKGIGITPEGRARLK